MEEKSLTLKQESEIRERAAGLKSEKKLRKVYPMVVFGDTQCGEKEIYVAYMAEPTFPQFSKFMAASKKDEVTAMRTLAKDCFLDGDRDLVDNDSLFLFGLMGQLAEIIQTRQTALVN
ncbi:hypothetical protein [Alistipes putredinis]|jgi:hypothetical protein|uniref:hypothetical protein n=1 Tax=Alistipes putredinis TaxID=28117 RepID=UPI0018971CEE|nr:hypothetical protein [Rikenellaceae bacterium]DAP23328.1 MAG TPA: hypothetical protein [Caudoviricetes sp.]